MTQERALTLGDVALALRPATTTPGLPLAGMDQVVAALSRQGASAGATVVT